MSENITNSQCIQCGYCCTVRPCFFGEWDYDKEKCKFLTEDKKCQKYEEIKENEKNEKYPMFGCGCSSSLFNTVREEKLKAIKDTVESIIDKVDPDTQEICSRCEKIMDQKDVEGNFSLEHEDGNHYIVCGMCYFDDGDD